MPIRSAIYYLKQQHAGAKREDGCEKKGGSGSTITPLNSKYHATSKSLSKLRLIALSFSGLFRVIVAIFSEVS